MTRLAWQCISTYRQTDYLGGCNGARIRFSPGKDWEVNKNLDLALDLLSPVKARHGPSLSWADLIVLAGNTALELSNTELSLPFCPGRTDDTEGRGWEDLQPRITGNFSSDSLPRLKDYISVMGLSQRQFAALLGAGHVIGDTHHCAGLYCRWGKIQQTTKSFIIINTFQERLLCL